MEKREKGLFHGSWNITMLLFHPILWIEHWDHAGGNLVAGHMQIEELNTEVKSEVPRVLRALDCFCGKGGSSDGFVVEGFQVTGIDILDAPKLLEYKHRFLLADMLKLKGEDFRGYDVIWGSPPCRDFSKMAYVGFGKSAWKVPPNPENGLKCVCAFLNFVEKARPHFWIMENVPGLAKHLRMKPIQISRIAPTKVRAFWGNYPRFLMPLQAQLNIRKNIKGTMYAIHGKNRSWERAKIPLACSQAFARACKEKLREE